MSKDTVDLNNIIIHLALTDIYKILHLIAGYPFFSNSHKTVNKDRPHVGHKTHLNTFKRTEIKQSMSLNYSGSK